MVIVKSLCRNGIEKLKLTKNRFYVLWLVIQANPICSILYMIITLIKALMSTLVTTMIAASFVDTATNILQKQESSNNIWQPLILMLLNLLFINVIGSITDLLNKYILFNVEKKYKPRIVKKQAAVEYKHIENDDSWKLISRVSTKPQEVLISGFNAFMIMLTTIIYIISILGIILLHVWWAAILILVFSVPMLRLSVSTGRKSYQATRDTEKFHRRTEYLQKVLTNRENIEERTMFRYGDRVSDDWWKMHEEGRGLRLKVRLRYMILTKGSTISMSVIAILVAVTLIPPVISGQLSAGIYMGLIGTVLGITHRIGWDMSSAVETIANTEEYLKDYAKFWNLSSDSNSLKKPAKNPIKFSELEFCNVRFKYPNSNKYVLDGLSFKIVSGKHYAFVGGNGVGKTTMNKLLTGLYTEYEGSIFVNGIELRNYSQEDIKALFSTVYQDFAKYSISIKDNIALGDVSSDYLDEQIEEIANKVGLYEMVLNLKYGIETLLGKIHNDGQDLSGGQWQKVAIARSLISRAPIKIFDEPTSALDPISESQIYYEFEKLMKGKTTIFISHRLGSTKLADEIMVLDSGRVVEQGTHDELMNKNGKYARMFETQRRWYQ